MEPLSRVEFAQLAPEFDAVVSQTPEVDHFCSSSDWVLPADQALMPPRDAWLWRGEHSWLACARGQNRGGWVLVQALEAAWGLASPVLGANPVLGAREIAWHLRGREHEWDVVLLSGLSLESAWFDALLRELAPHYGLRGGTPTRRHVASLEGGLDGFLSRRSRNLRKSIKKSQRRAEEAGITLVAAHADADDADAIYERILDVERRSWKGKEGVGIESGGMREFYRLMNRRLARRGAQRCYFAQHEGRDIGYVLGGVLADSYRGLQFSYDDDYAEYGIGGVLQMAQITELCAQGFTEYDLGTDLAYKQRWSDDVRETVLLIIGKS